MASSLSNEWQYITPKSAIITDMITYRKATPSDLDDLYNISIRFNEFNAHRTQDYKAFFPDNWKEDFREEIEESLEDEKSITYIALDEAKVVGMVTSYYCEKCWYTIISDIFVDADYRGKGVGAELFKRAEEWCSKYKCPLRIEVYDWNDEALAFYKKRGYKVDCYVLEKR
jgi:GNAT superfamily N-acetyltransferase